MQQVTSLHCIMQIMHKFNNLPFILDQTVAVKAIDMKGIKDSISRQMLQCEIQALRTIKHENVLKCYDVVKQTSHCFIITQFCNGGDLSGYLKKKRRLSQQQTLKLLRDIVSGFIEIGQKGFLHRDLKLANIFINDEKAKIADFGFAKKIRMSSEKQKYNVGSPLYMSPEALKRNIYSLKNDIWSIGIMTYEMLHGETPWECKTERQLIDKMVKIPVRFRESIKISQSTKQFIKKCLEVDEKDRMSLEDLKQWINAKQSKSDEYLQKNILGPSRSQNLPPRLNLNHKPMSNIQKMTYQNQNQTAKLQLTHRLSTRSQKQISAQCNKENVANRPSRLGPIPKSLIERNNYIVVNEINTFRLIFKLMEKIRKNIPQQLLLINLLANQVIKRVTTLKSCFDCNQNQYGLSMIENYMNQRQNEGIKKYKSVVMEYYKKYTAEIKYEEPSGFHPLNTQIHKFLRNQSTLREEEELLICYWMIQYLSINRETPKQKLDAIIEPKIKLNKGYIEQRIKELN